MTRIQLHRNEYERGWTRVLMLGLIVLLLGSFSAVMVMLVAVEAGSGTFAPCAQTGVREWFPCEWRVDLPVAAGMLTAAVLSALAVGVHSLSRGAILGFLTSLFNLFPLYLGAGSGIEGVRFSPVAWGAFFLSAVLAFYVGDLGSWLCRRRLQRETAEDLVHGVLAGKAEENWL